MFAKTVTVYETVKFNLSRWSVVESVTFKSYFNIISHNVT